VTLFPLSWPSAYIWLTCALYRNEQNTSFDHLDEALLAIGVVRVFALELLQRHLAVQLPFEGDRAAFKQRPPSARSGG
jgi:hypothetical protein